MPIEQILVDDSGNRTTIGGDGLVVGLATGGTTVDAANPLPTTLPGRLCTSNSSTTLLDAEAAFTGAWIDTLNYGIAVISIAADQDSAIDGLAIEWSADGVTADQDDVFSISASVGKVFTFTPAAQYMRVKLTNGAVAQGSLHLQTIMRQGFKASSHRISGTLVGEDDAELVKAVLSGLGPDGEFVNIGSTHTGNLKVSLHVDAPSELKFGFQGAVGKTVRELVWDLGGAYPAWPGNGTLTVASSAAGDTSIGITVQGLDATGAEITETLTTDAANGTVSSSTGAVLTFSSVARAWVSAGTAPTGTITVSRGGTGFVGILPTFGQSQTCRWTVPTIIDGVTYAGAWVKELHVQVGAADKADISLVAETPTDVMPRVKRFYSDIQGPVVENFHNGGTIAGLYFPAGTVISVDAKALNTTAEVSASFLAGMTSAAP